MSSERKAAVIRILFSLGMIVAAVAVAMWFGVSGFSFGREKLDDARVTAESIDALRHKSGCVVVIHSHQEDNEDSERTQVILRELKVERYEDLVEMGEFDIEEFPEEAKKEGVTKKTAPQLSFYIEGSRVGDYRGPWNKVSVQRKIDEILRGYMQRIGKDWRPPVHGMQRDDGSQPILEIRPKEN